MLTLEEIKKQYESLKVNKAELLALRLYTGPMFGAFDQCTPLNEVEMLPMINWVAHRKFCKK